MRYCSYRRCTSSSMVQLVLLCFQVLTEGLLECWSHFGHRPDSVHPHGKEKRHKRRGGRRLVDLPLKHPSLDMETKTTEEDEHAFPMRAFKSNSWRLLFPWTRPKVLDQHPCNGCWRPPYMWGPPWSLHLLRCEQEQTAEGNEAESLQPSFYTPQLSIGASVSPLSQEVSRHDVITFTTIAAFSVERYLIRVCLCPYRVVWISSPGGGAIIMDTNLLIYVI